jgi:enterochelin esterase family protein
MRRRAAWAFGSLSSWLLGAWVAVVLPVPGSAADLNPGELVGTWELNFTTPDGNQHAPVLVLSRDGDQLKGTLNKLAESELAAKGISLKGGELTFQVSGTHEGAPFTLTFKGKPEKDTIKGEVEYEHGGNTGSFEFSGQRAQPVQARRATRPRTPNDTLKSPEVAPDHKVTFRIYAPKASEVTMAGDWMTQGPGGGGVKLEKDPQGVWSITVGPLVPDFYSYSFTVDGVRTVDPKNAMIKQGVASLDSMFELPGPEDAFEANKDIPHGEIRQAWYHSGTLNMMRRMHVYTPPGYDASSGERYPVFYLLHGGGDEDSGWSTIGRAGFIMDNLLAERKVRPMLVVMPNGSLPRPANLPPFRPGGPPSPEFVAAMEALQQRFTDELLKEVVPFVEKNYRVVADREARAIAGLSMGGGQTLRVVTTHPDQFAYVGVWSAGLFGNAKQFEERNAAFLGDADRVNKLVRLLSISVGDKDFLVAGSKDLTALLEKKGIKHEFHLSGGGHTWINWRHYLNEFAPKLFR